MVNLKFPAREVSVLVEHAMTFPPLVNSDRFRRDPAYWKRGTVAGADGMAASEDVDPVKIPRYLILTREGGSIFLVAGTNPPLHRRVFADEFPPDNTRAAALAAAVGDRDFAEELDLHWFSEALHPGCRFVRLAISEAQIRRVAPVFAPAERPRTTANRPR
jgi:hypothetical protein